MTAQLSCISMSSMYKLCWPLLEIGHQPLGKDWDICYWEVTSSLRTWNTLRIYDFIRLFFHLYSSNHIKKKHSVTGYKTSLSKMITVWHSIAVTKLIIPSLPSSSCKICFTRWAASPSNTFAFVHLSFSALPFHLYTVHFSPFQNAFHLNMAGRKTNSDAEVSLCDRLRRGNSISWLLVFF